MTKPKITSGINLDYKCGYAAGLAAGAKRERRAIRRWQLDNAPFTEEETQIITKGEMAILNHYFSKFDKFMASRARKGKRK